MISRFSITDTQRQDAGIYVCTAQNAYGTDAVVFQLTVLGKIRAIACGNLHIITYINCACAHLINNIMRL